MTSGVEPSLTHLAPANYKYLESGLHLSTINPVSDFAAERPFVTLSVGNILTYM